MGSRVEMGRYRLVTLCTPVTSFYHYTITPAHLSSGFNRICANSRQRWHTRLRRKDEGGDDSGRACQGNDEIHHKPVVIGCRLWLRLRGAAGAAVVCACWCRRLPVLLADVRARTRHLHLTILHLHLLFIEPLRRRW